MNKINKINFFSSLIITVLIFSGFSLCAQKYEIVQSEKIFINDHLPLFPSKSVLIKHLGKFTKITEVFPECGPYGDDSANGVRFFTYSKNGMKFLVYEQTTEFDEIDLKSYPNNYITIGKHRINSKTTFSDLKKMFPVAYKMVQKEGKLATLRLKFNKDWDDEVLILLNNDKVSSVLYWTPC